jgi:hypothetical protein
MKNAAAERSVRIRKTVSANDASASVPSTTGNTVRLSRRTRSSDHTSGGSAR